MALTVRQARFVQEYLVDLNATQAAIRAGYATKTANQAGPRLLVNVGISAAIAKAQAKRAERIEVKQDEVLLALLDVLRSDVRDFQVDDDGVLTLRDGAPDRAWKAVQSVKHKITKTVTESETEIERDIEFRLWSKPDALRMAMQHLGLLVEKHEVTGKGGVPLRFTFAIGEPDAGRD